MAAGSLPAARPIGRSGIEMHNMELPYLNWNKHSEAKSSKQAAASPCTASCQIPRQNPSQDPDILCHAPMG